MNGDATVGLIGLGAIGTPICERLLAAGFRLVVHDVRREAMAPFADRAALAASPVEVAERASVVIGCLSTLDSYRAVVLGPDGLVEGGAIRRYLHIGTTGADIVRELGAALAARGIETVDAPVTGGVPRARNGTLTVIAAGPAAGLAACEAIFRAYGDRIVLLGERIGDAQIVKLVNNMLSAANLAMACEALTFAARIGIDPEKVLEVVNSGTGQSEASLNKVPRHVLTRRFDYGGSLRITLKDTAAYEREARRAGAPTVLATAVADAYRAAAASGLEDGDMTTIGLYFERLAAGAVPSDRESVP